MEDATSVLLDLPGFRVVEARRIENGTAHKEQRLVVVETVEPVATCPGCGVLAARVHERPQGEGPAGRVGPAPAGPAQRRYRCEEGPCPRRSFTETSEQVSGRARVTERLRERLADAVGTSLAVRPVRPAPR